MSSLSLPTTLESSTSSLLVAGDGRVLDILVVVADAR